MTASPRRSGWFIVFIAAALLGCVLTLLNLPPTPGRAISVPGPSVTSAGGAVSEVPTGGDAGSPSATAKPAAEAGLAQSRWLEGSTIWSSPTVRSTGGGLRRVRLLKVPSQPSVIRVEESLTPGENGQPPMLTRQNAMVADRLLVKATAGTPPARLAEAMRSVGGSLLGQIPGSDVHLVQIPAVDGQSLPAAVEALENLKGLVAYAEPDYLVHSTATPNDPQFAGQWSLHNTGQDGGTVDADIDAPEAWEITTGSSSVVVAVLDSGMQHTLADLTANVWRNQAELSGTAGVDDDGNGHIDDIYGWNFLNGNNSTLDSYVHGTHVAGIIGAAGNNGVGVSGVAQQVQLMPVKFLDHNGYGTTSNAIAAINYARSKGAHIINNSWGGQEFSQPLKDAVDAASAEGILSVCAVDNGNGRNEDVTPNYPSGFDSPFLLAVANTTNKDVLFSTSDYGPTTVDLGAPGTNILSMLPNGSHGAFSGTSLAAPHVSGIAALLKAHKPALTAAEIRDIILSSVDVLPSLRGKVATEGRANAANALRVASSIGALPAHGMMAVGFPGGPFSPSTTTYALKNYRATAIDWTASLPEAPWASMSPASGTLAPGESAQITVTLNSGAAAAPPGAQARVLTITDTTNHLSITRPVVLDVRIPHIYSYNLDTDPGWPREGWWQFGAPSGRGGTGFQSNPDPASAATGSNVLGVFLHGNPPPEAGGKRSITAGPFDLRGYTETTLKFQRWLNISRPSIDGAHTVEISNNGGTTWTSLWTDVNSSVYDNIWRPQSLTLGSAGDNQAAVLIRWTYTTTNLETRSSAGWNIDDIQIEGTPGHRVFLRGVAAAAENSETAAFTLHVEPPSTTPLTISLSSDTPGAATLPASVTVPAHATVVDVPVTLVDDAVLDGSQTATLTPTAAGYVSVPWTLTVTDNETTTLSLAVPATATEGNPYLQGVLTLAHASPNDVWIKLTSSHPYHLGVPASLLVPAGRTRMVFPISAPQNSVVEGPKTVEINATMPGWTGATASVVLADDDASALILTFPLSAGSYHYAEGVATTGFNGTASIPTRRLVDTVITLSHDGGGRLTLPASVTVPAGALSAPITPVSITDDALQNGVARVTVTASAPDMPESTSLVTVADNDASTLTFDMIPSPQATGSTVAIVLRALDMNGDLAAGHGGAATISGLNAGAADAGFTSVTATFAKGVAMANVALPTASESYSLQATADTAAGTSNTFAVGAARVRTVGLAARDLVYYPGTNRLYAGTSSGTIVPIHPVTGVLESPITVATTAVTKIRVSATGMLHALVDNATRLVPVDLTTRTVGTPFGFGSRSGVAHSAVDFAVVPGMASTVLVSFNELDVLDPKMSVFINGVRATFSIYRSALGNPGSQVYHYVATGGLPNQVYACGGNKLFVLSISSTGVTVLKSHVLPDEPGTIDCSGLSVVGRNGRAFDAGSGALLGRLKANEEVSHAAMIDATMRRAAVIAHPPSSPFLYDLCLFETSRFSEISRIRVPVEPLYGQRIIRFGTNGLAYLGASQVVLVTATELPEIGQPRADVAISQLPGPVAPRVGANLSFSLMVRNDGAAAAENVVVTNRWPPGAPFVTASTTRGTFTLTEEAATFHVGTLAPEQMATLTVTVTAQAGTATNTAWVTTSSPEYHTLNNTSTGSATSVTYNATSSYGRMFNLGTADMVSMKSQRRLLATAGANAGFFAGTVAVIDPDRWAIVAFVPVGSDAGRIVLADDESKATVALNSSGSLVPFNPLTYEMGMPYNLGTAADDRNFLINEMVAVPGRPDRLAIARRSMAGTGAGAAIYQGAARIGTATAAGVADDSLAFGADATQLFGHSATSMVRMAVSEGGLAVQATGSSQGQQRRIHYGSGRIVTSNAGIIDPTSLIRTGYLPDNYSTDVAVCLDPARGRIFAASVSNLYAYEDVTCTRVGGISASGFGGEPTAGMVRWGNTGVAFHRQTFIQAWDLDTFVPLPVVSVILPGTMAENAGTLVGTLQLQGGPSPTPLTINLQSSLPAVAQVPAIVTLPAGQLTASFDIDITNDDILNGGRQVSVIPSGATTHLYETGSTQVTDDESTTVTLNLPATVAENAGVVANLASVTLGRPADADIVVRLGSSQPAILTVPATVTIPYGASTVAVPLTVVDDSYIRGDRSVSITATVPGWTADTKILNVTDDENATLSFSPGTLVMSEQGGFPFVTVELGGYVDLPVEVTLTSSHPDRLTVYSPATISYQGKSASVTVRTVNNTALDGRQEVIVTASAPGFASATLPVTVKDDDLAGFTWEIPAHVPAGTAVNITASSRTIDGDPVELYPAPTLVLSAARGAAAVPLDATTPLTRITYPPDPSKYAGTATLTSAGPDTTLSFVHNGVTHTSPPFTVQPGPHASFLWAPIDPYMPQPGQTFPVTIRAADVFGNAVTSFSSTASLSAAGHQVTKPTGTGSTLDVPLISTALSLGRHQIVYLASDIGQAGRLRVLYLQVVQSAGRAFDKLTIRAKHTTTSVLYDDRFDNTGWTTLKQGPLSLMNANGWVAIPLDTPFDYNGTSNLIFDISHESSDGAGGGACACTTSGNTRTLYATTDSYSGHYGDPLLWHLSGNSPITRTSIYRPNMRFGFGTALTVTPTTTENFANGVWSGNVTLGPAAAGDVKLTAMSGSGAGAATKSGDSGFFDLGAITPSTPVLTPLATLAAGTSISLTWDAVSVAAEYYLELATDSTFATPLASSGWISTLAHTFPSLPSDTRYHVRIKARRGAAESAWSTAVSTTLDSVGPVITLGNGDSGSGTTPVFTTTRSQWIIDGRLFDRTAGIQTSSASRYVAILSGSSTLWANHNVDGTWSYTLPLPNTGSHSFTFRNIDLVGNTTLRAVTVVRKADTDSNGLPDDWQTANGLALAGPNSGRTADFDSDGRSNLLEYAFNTAANNGGGNACPHLAGEVHGTDGKTYLIYRYDRRQGAVDLTYNLEFSTNLSAWSGSTFQTEMVGTPTLNADGVTERVTLRILPDISQPQAQKVFVRTAVTSLVP